MSYTKHTFEQIINAVHPIQQQTLNDNDLTAILEALNSLIDLAEKFKKADGDLEFYWNEIVSDSISVVYAALSGQYRLAMTGLRSLLEISGHAFYYIDHKIELKLFVAENSKADKYINTLINQHSFFTTSYIKTFYPSITTIQTKEDSVSSTLSSIYSKLCDVVHGRYATLTKTSDLKIRYEKDLFKKFESTYIKTLSIIACMYILRFGDFSNAEIKKLATHSNVINL